MEPVKIVERGGWKGGAKGAGKKMRRREGEWTAPLPLAKGCQSIRGRQKEQKGRESNWAPARWSASWRSIWQLSPHLPSHSRQINYDAVSLPNHPPTWYADPIHQSRAGKLRSARRNSCRGAVNCTHPREWCDGPCICFLFSFLYYFSLCVPKYYHFFLQVFPFIASTRPKCS